MKQPMIISDFDGTITIEDTNTAIWSYFDHVKSEEIKNKYRKNPNEKGMRWLLHEEYKNLNITRREFEKYIKNNIEIEPTFIEFLKYIKINNYKFAIISGGFIDYIDILLDKYNIIKEFPIHANKLIFPEDIEAKNNYITAEFKYSKNESRSKYGVTSTPKGRIIKKYRESFSPIFYLGDSKTDRHAIKYTDFILAKKDTFFEEYCKNNNYDYFSFKNFDDARLYIQSIIK